MASEPLISRVWIRWFMDEFCIKMTNILKLGMTVVADSVNAIQITREAWKNVAKDASVTFFEVELVCSDSREHQRRIETRDPDIIGH